MRMIGHLNGEQAARKMSDFLFTHGIENQIEPEAGAGWAIWILADEDLDRAKGWLGKFRENPEAAHFVTAARDAQALRDQRAEANQAFERRVKGPQQLFRPLTQYGFGPLTLGLIVLSVVVFFKSGFGEHMGPVFPLYISEYDVRGGIWSRILHGLPEVRHGQVWRLVTPIFMHGDFLHIFFNMLWLRDLGSMIEGRQGTGRFAVLVLVLAVFSNFCQFALAGPNFLGMSGVVYGLLGYVWMRGKFDPASGLAIHPTTVTMMVVWFFLGLTGFMRMANGAHGGGLVLGVVWGWLASRPWRRGR